VDKKAIQSSKWYKKLLELAVEDFISVNQFSRPDMLLNSQSAHVHHYTANPGPGDEQHKIYFENLKNQNPHDEIEDRYASAHIFIDKDSARIIIPLWGVAYQAGNTWYNRNSISTELCMEKDGSFHPETIKRAVKISALCQLLFGYKTDRNIRHYDIEQVTKTGKKWRKICPKPWVENPALFTKFKQDVDAQIKAYVNESTHKPVGSVDKCSIEVNGKTIEPKGFLQGGHSFIPVRAVAETVGVMPAWCPTSKQVTVNGQDVTETIIAGVSYAPARELAGILNMQVDWCGETKTVKLKGCV